MRRFWEVAIAVAWRSIHKSPRPQPAAPVDGVPDVLLRRLRRRPVERRRTCRASTSRPATRRSSSCSCCCRRRRSAACSPASGSRPTSRTASPAALLAAPNRLGIIAGYALAASCAARSSGILLFVVALLTGCRSAAAARPLRARRARLPRLAHGDAVLGGRRDAPAARSRPARDADAGLPRPVPRAGVRAARAAVGLGAPVANVNPFTPLIETGRDFISGSHPDLLLAAGSRSGSCSASPSGRCAGCAAPRRRAERPRNENRARASCPGPREFPFESFPAWEASLPPCTKLIGTSGGT